MRIADPYARRTVELSECEILPPNDDGYHAVRAPAGEWFAWRPTSNRSFPIHTQPELLESLTTHLMLYQGVDNLSEATSPPPEPVVETVAALFGVMPINEVRSPARIAGIPVEVVDLSYAGDADDKYDDSDYMEKAERYFSVGHKNDNDDDSEDGPPWYYNSDWETVEVGRAGQTHNMVFGVGQADKYHKGRFDVRTGELSVTCPYGRKPAGPAFTTAVTAAVKRFGGRAKVKAIVVFDYHTSNESVVDNLSHDLNESPYDKNALKAVFVVGAGGCLAGDTLIAHPDGTQTPVAELSKRGTDFDVVALDSMGLSTAATAISAWLKGWDELHRVTFTNGYSVEVTSLHRFRTQDGWTSLADGLSVGDVVVGCGPSHVMSHSNALNLQNTLEDSKPHCSMGRRHCGEPPHGSSSTGSISPPRPVDEDGRSLKTSRSDGMVVERECTPPYQPEGHSCTPGSFRPKVHSLVPGVRVPSDDVEQLYESSQVLSQGECLQVRSRGVRAAELGPRPVDNSLWPISSVPTESAAVCVVDPTTGTRSAQTRHTRQQEPQSIPRLSNEGLCQPGSTGTAVGPVGRSTHPVDQPPAPEEREQSARSSNRTGERVGGSTTLPGTVQQRQTFSNLSSDFPVRDWRIVSIEPCGVKEYYDLEVPEYENYLAAGVFHHNSGKTKVAKEMFAGSDFKVINQDVHFERMLDKAGVAKVDAGKLGWDAVDRVRKLANMERDQYAKQRLGLVIDGTGWNYARVAEPVRRLRELGYDCYMVVVKTSLETSLKRNDARGKAGGRIVPPLAVKDAHDGLFANLDAYRKLFGPANLTVIDNDADTSDAEWRKTVGDLARRIAKTIGGRRIRNPIGQAWLADPYASKLKREHKRHAAKRQMAVAESEGDAIAFGPLSTWYAPDALTAVLTVVHALADEPVTEDDAWGLLTAVADASGLTEFQLPEQVPDAFARAIAKLKRAGDLKDYTGGTVGFAHVADAA